MKECEFYDNNYCRCADSRVPQEIGYADILCSDKCNNTCVFKQLLAEQTKNKKLVEALKEIRWLLGLEVNNAK